MDQSAFAMKLQIPRDVPGVIAGQLDLLGGESDLGKVRAFEYPRLHRLLDLCLVLFRRHLQTSSLHPQADTGRSAVIDRTPGNRCHHNMLVTGARQPSALSHMDRKGAAAWVNLSLRRQQWTGPREDE